MKFSHKHTKVGLCIFALSALSACGYDHNSVPKTGPAGKITQGPVKDATVYADSLVSGTRGVLDAGEIATKTDSKGDFQFDTQPTYAHQIVSIGGTDILTNQPAMQMLAPAGSKNVTPLTTLVALDTTGEVKAKIEALLPTGAKFDADTSTVTSQAALLLIKAVESSVQTLTTAIKKSGTVNAAQIASIQTEALKSVAAEIAKPAVTVATITTTSDLAATMKAAASAALTTITTNNTNITITPAAVTAAADSISAAIVTTATNIGVTSTATTTQISGGEAAVITPAVAQTIATAVTEAAGAITIDATKTPDNFAPIQLDLPPVVAAVTPAKDAAINGGVATLSITFTEAMLNRADYNESAANPANWVIKTGTSTIAVTAVKADTAAKTFTATTASLPNGAAVSVTLNSRVISAAGVKMAANYSWSFTTKPTGSAGSSN